MATIYIQTEDFYIEKYTWKKPSNEMHYHHAYELYFIIDGEREYFIEDSFFHAKAGDLVWVPANHLHRTSGPGGTRFLLYFKESFLLEYFSPSTIRRLVSEEPFAFTPDSQQAEAFQNMFFELLKEFNKKKAQDDDYDEFLIAKKLFEFLCFIDSNENRYTKRGSVPGERMFTIVKYINDHFHLPLTIQEVADTVGITKDHLCHIFPKYMGMTLVTYLNVVRIKAACEMLRKEQDSILDISIKCGFSSSHYFCKIFKREKGVSPSEYRRQFIVISSKKRAKMKSFNQSEDEP